MNSISSTTEINSVDPVTSGVESIRTPVARDCPARECLEILNVQIDALTWEQILSRIFFWTAHSEPRYVCFCNVHSLVTAQHDAVFHRAVDDADIAAPDGMPVAWLMRRRGASTQQRINGPDLMWRVAARAAIDGTPIYLYGATDRTLVALTRKLKSVYPGVNIAGQYAPPFRPLTQNEEEQTIQAIVNSGARLVFIGLGCPRQEIWMSKISRRIPAVLFGVGAAFDYHAGIIRRAPLWMQRRGLEWLYRLCAEPRRLWRRYFITNTVFLYYLLRQRLRTRNRRHVAS